MPFRMPALFANIFQRKIQEPAPQADLVDLYAFRTIITMISLIRSAKRIPEERIKPVSAELKIVDAMAAIIIREHGVAAVSAVSANPGSGKIQIFASVSFLIAQNPRKSKGRNLEESSTDPFTIDPTGTIPEHHKRITKPCDLLDAFLTDVWHKPDITTFETHVWMLAKLLGRREDPFSFLSYVMVSCYKKLIMRMTHRISNNYRIALENVPTFEFVGGSYPDPTPNELHHDQAFLHENLPGVKSFLGIEIPNLLRQVDSRNFYTRETCNEYHRLLCKLLALLLDALRELGALRKDQPDLKKIHMQLKLITLFGVTLRSMFGGATMMKHLLAIQQYLPDVTALVKQTEDAGDDKKDAKDAKDAGGDKKDAGDDKDADEDEDEEDAEFQLNARLGPKACLDWLKLMVVHFDAAQRLADHVKTTKTSEVVIKIVSQSPPDRYMLPWKALLANTDYFPDSDDFSASDIINFLSSNTTTTAGSSDPTAKMLSAETLVQRLQEIPKIPKVIDTDNGREINLKAFNEAIDPIINTVRKMELTNCVSVGWEDHAKVILANLIKFQAAWTLSDEVMIAEDISKIIEMVDTMKDNAMIYWALRPNSPLDTGIGFVGNYHAEAILAAFLHQNQKVGSATLGVSKWCCPVCAFLLLKLNEKGNPFIFTNQHHTITPCALPHGLTSSAIKLMIKEFGGQLQKALSELRDRTDLLQPCDSSVASGHFSETGSDHSHVKFLPHA